MHVCQYCKKSFSTKSNLNMHIKTAKYCLELRGETNLEFSCKYCDLILTSKRSQQTHEEKCQGKNIKEFSDKNTKLIEELASVKNIAMRLKKENTTLKQEISGLEQNKILLQQKVSDLEQEITDLLGLVAKSNTKNITNNTVMLTNAYINTMPSLDLTENNIEKVLDQLVFEDTDNGAYGISKFLEKNLLTDDYNKLRYICTDISRRMFKYKDTKRNTQKDAHCDALFSAIYDPLVSKIKNLYRERILFNIKSDENWYCKKLTDQSMYFEDPEMFKPDLVGNIAKMTCKSKAITLDDIT